MRPALLLMLVILQIMVSGTAGPAADEAPATGSPTPLKIVRITPGGDDVPPGRQIVIQFNRPVVPLGRMDRDPSEIPVTLEPPLNCNWRWLNTSALACQLNEKDAMAAATSYRLTIEQGIEAGDGATTERKIEHRFVTQRPDVRHTWFRTWKSPGMPVVRITFNQPVTRESVRQHLFLTLPGIKGKRVELTVEPDPDDRKQPLLVPLPGQKKALLVAPAGESGPKQKGPKDRADGGREARRVWLVAPDAELPLDSAVKLAVEPGLRSYYGPEAGAGNRDLVALHTFPEFAFKGVRCTTNDRRQILIRPKDGGTAARRCNPLSRVALVFSAPVISDEVKAHVAVTPDLAGNREDYDPWANYHSYSRLNSPHRRGNTYDVWLPEVLKAFETYRIDSAAGELRDEFGRALADAIALKFHTDHRPPNFVLTHQRAVLEKAVPTEQPVVVTNLETLTATYDRITAADSQKDQTLTIQIPQARDVAFRVPLQIRNMLSGQSGAVQGTLTSTPPVAKHAWNRWFFTQVTPFQVHAKVGHYNTLVWVSDLHSGESVENATVGIFAGTYKALADPPEQLTQARTNSNGIAILPGTRKLDPDLKRLNEYDLTKPRLFIRLTRGADMALLPLDSGCRINTYRASRYTVASRMRKQYGHIRTWGTTAQGVYRAGDTIQYKFYVRDQSNQAFVPPPREGYRLTIIDPAGKSVHQVEQIRLSEFGAYHGEFAVAENAAVGWYRFQLAASFYEGSWEPMRVLVSDFTPAPFRVSSDLNAAAFQPGQAVEIATAARLHAGGPYAGAAARITATLESSALRPGHPAARGFYFDTYLRESQPRQQLYQTQAQVDRNGNLTSRFTLPESTILFGRMTVESAVRDDRGKYVTSRSVAAYSGRDRFVGLRSDQWVLEADQPAQVAVLVVDQNGEPLAGIPVGVTIERRETKASRVKGAGNAYLTQYTHEWIVTETQQLASLAEPVQGRFTPAAPGTYRLTATIEDSQGRAHSSSIHQWVAGKGRVVWEQRNDDSLEIVAEKSTWKVGERARYMVKNPFPGAQALMTIERYGVMKSWLQPLDTGTPIIEFDVEPDYLPGYFLSVVVFSPRVDRPMGEGRVDLGKPAMRMGYAKADVVDSYKTLDVTVATERKNYKPGDRVAADIQAAARQGTGDEPIELAIAVLDEAVLDLLAEDTDTFDPYRGFYTIDGLDLQNYSLLRKLVGRQKFEKKGASPGGGGGFDVDFRSVFKFLSYWNPSLKIKPGTGTRIEFDVPDNLTGWRILAMAVTPGDRMGLGCASFRVNRPTEIRPVMPNQVTEGDRFTAGFSIMNRTPDRRELTVRIEASGDGAVAAGLSPEVVRKIVAEPYKRQTVWLPVKTGGAGTLEFKAAAGDDIDRDGIRHTLEVRKRYSLETAATYGSTSAAAASESIVFPPEIRKDGGRVSVVLSPSVIANLEGAFRYLRDYPYTCWEQILTRGVMASHYQTLKAYLPADFEWGDSKSVVEDVLVKAAAFQAPNGGMGYLVSADRYASPYLSAYTALAFNWLRQSGASIPTAVEEKLHGYLKRLLRRNVLPDFYTRGMAATVRAVALAALAEAHNIDRSDILRYRPHVDRMSLFGKAHFLMAAQKIPGTENIQAELVDRILAHAAQSGGKFIFSETIDDSYTRILSSALRTNAAVLSAILGHANTLQGKERLGDIPFKTVRYITETRANRDHWENTQENMFCMNALVAYSRIYEHQPPSMTLTASLDQAPLGQAAFGSLRDDPVTFERRIQKTDPGRNAVIHLQKAGEGRYYYATRLSYAPAAVRKEPVHAGIEIKREYSVERDGDWVLLKSPMQIRRGELVRIDLFISLPSARHFAVVDDPVPGGLEPVNRNLATASTVDATKGDYRPAGGSWWFRYSDWSSYGVSRWSFYHQELRHHAVRFYSDHLPAGNYHLAYTAQAITPGEFIVRPVHAEEMYDPEVFGRGVPAKLSVSMN